MGVRPLQERIAEKRAQKERYDKKVEKCDEELKALLKKEAEETRKQRTHKLIVAGAELAALYGRTLEKDEILALVEFLLWRKRKRQLRKRYGSLKRKRKRVTGICSGSCSIFEKYGGVLYCIPVSKRNKGAIQTGKAHLIVIAPFHGEQYKY